MRVNVKIRLQVCKYCLHCGPRCINTAYFGLFGAPGCRRLEAGMRCLRFRNPWVWECFGATSETRGTTTVRAQNPHHPISCSWEIAVGRVAIVHDVMNVTRSSDLPGPFCGGGSARDTPLLACSSIKRLMEGFDWA